ncbi:biotin-dependent carboxyltransferase family protein [Amycolatopsis acidiphila]|uniref:Biotin-dependent carboxyltransferase family protein n=1 Tax=Amycolatopsis acidiphila TaxID=715473 RepID=A0A558A2I2_9PSEU|nr:biotin-dependent carboxyltransferase family protein [Amycolatopsis acidiphila]TVT18468.1 biotin-dependent carboxyltransferase family protein [Amycolatopsis acidiphila]UIJ60019.1 biotin-dependent carboxyltransferase family protein [Amycolatopsis acidiphila]GHG61831.1 allophanate hydrolase [Amycolatopsis acidiphila]
MRALDVVATGPSALVQDLGRPGLAHLGVPPSGALDVPALRLANRLVGNDETCAGIEALFGGLTVRARTSCTVAVTGPPVRVTVDERAHGTHTPIHVSAGQTLAIGTPDTGLRCYLAVSGGVAVEPELGSRSRDVLSGIGPEPLEPGNVLPLGAPRGTPTGEDELAAPRLPAELVVPVLLGPRDDWFDEPARLLAVPWTVTPESNRVGLRLDGAPLRRAREGELASEGLVTGAIQVPSSGLPVVFLADHPTTGGYPVIGVVVPSALPALAQARPGTTLRFRPQA